MSKSVNILSDGSFQIISTNNKTGKVDDAVILPAEPVMTHKQIGAVLGQTVKSSGTFRSAACSFLALVYAVPKLDGYKGTGDLATGKLTPEFKASVRSAEEIVVSDLVKEGAIKLPKGNEEEQFQAFMSALRDDKNYSNAKNTTNKYFALCGANCITGDDKLVPVPVMQAQIAEAVHRPPVDNSLSAKLRGVKELLDGMTIDAPDALDSLVIARDLLATLEGVVNEYAKMATAARAGVDVQADAAIEKAAVGSRHRVAKTDLETA